MLYLKIDEKGSRHAQYEGLYQNWRQGKNPISWWPAGLKGQLAGGGLWGCGRIELDDRGRKGVFNEESVGIHPSADRLEQELRWVQNKLFDVGGLLATAPGQTFKNMPTVTARDVTRLEKLMDRCQKDLPPLKEFILPGGGKIPSLLHQARTICRRAERLCVRLGREEPLDRLSCVS